MIKNVLKVLNDLKDFKDFKKNGVGLFRPHFLSYHPTGYLPSSFITSLYTVSPL